MLNEPGGTNEGFALPAVPAYAPVDTLHARLRAAVEEVFFIESERDDLPQPITVSYTGRLTMDSVEAYDKLDKLFEPLDHLPAFTIEGNQQVVRALRGRFHVTPRPVWPNVVLFIATLLSLLYVGATGEIQREVASVTELLYGWPYALGVILILGTHEMGHYFAARYHRIAVTLPYFIPMPVGLGTMGAFIQLRQLMKNRRVLLDVGAAGPLAGMIVAIPILLIGLKTSPITPMPMLKTFMLQAGHGEYVLEGNSIVYAVAKIIAFGHFLPDGMHDVQINQLASAGWLGLLVTSLNLIPLGQLDGGHIIFSLIGDRARRLFFPIMLIMVTLSILYGFWFVWIVLLFLLGRIYAVPLDMITKLDRRRQIIAVVALIVFVLVFMPIPLQSFTY